MTGKNMEDSALLHDMNQNMFVISEIITLWKIWDKYKKKLGAKSEDQSISIKNVRS